MSSSTTRPGLTNYEPPFITFLKEVEAMQICTSEINALTGRLMLPDAANSICMKHADRIEALIAGRDLKMSALVRERVKILRGYNKHPPHIAFTDKEKLELYQK